MVNVLRDKHRETSKIGVNNLREESQIIDTALNCYDLGQLSYEEALEVALIKTHTMYSHFSQKRFRRTTDKLWYKLSVLGCLTLFGGSCIYLGTKLKAV